MPGFYFILFCFILFYFIFMLTLQSFCTQAISEEFVQNLIWSTMSPEALKDQRKLINCLDSVSKIFKNQQKDKDEIHSLELLVNKMSKDHKGIYLFI